MPRILFTTVVSLSAIFQCMLGSHWSTAALPLGLVQRDVPIEKCTTVDQGYLALDGSASGSFTLKSNVLSYDPAGKALLPAEFQACTPNFGQWKNDGSEPITAGQIYLPKTNQCLSVQDLAGSAPYSVTAVDCEYSDDSRQFFYNFIKKNGHYYWAGSTNADGSRIRDQKTCSTGFFGYTGKTGGQPSTSSSDPSSEPIIGLTCESNSNSFGFRIAN